MVSFLQSGPPIKTSASLTDLSVLLCWYLQLPWIVIVLMPVRRHLHTPAPGYPAAWTENVTDIQDAVWWPSRTAMNGGRPSPSVRRLEGEIHLPKDLQPSSAVGHFTLSVRSFSLSFFALES